MDSIKNPFSPNAGSRPPELAGREDIFDLARVLMGRTQQRRSAQSLLMTGLRGVGKTVILNEILNMAETDGNIMPIYMEASENRRIGELLASPLRMMLLKLNRLAGAQAKVRRGLSILRNFLGTIKISIGDIGIELDPHTGEGDSGDMQFDLQELLDAVAEAAASQQKGVILLIDEVQYLTSPELEALVMALHHMQQRQRPLVMVGAGLPIVAKLAGEAKSYAERLFKFPQVGSLPAHFAADALCRPFADAGIRLNPDAIKAIVDETRGYPFFLQEWGSQLWNFIEKAPVTIEDVKSVRNAVLDSLDANFFRIRMERVTPSEREFMLAMAKVSDNDAPCRIVDVARRLGVVLNALGPRRSSLKKKGMVYSPSHGMIAFTVPMFSDYLKRNP